jgi:ribosomal 50S subunit-associated protein YjgA (DUF615 family)
MRRVLAVLVGAGLAVGGGAAAWAGTAGAGGPNREAVKACRDQAREELPDGDRAALREAVRACLDEAGVDIPAKRAEVRDCVMAAKDANPDDKVAARAAARQCLAAAGVAPGRLRARFAQARECLGEVRGDHPDASKSELRDLVKECVANR